MPKSRHRERHKKKEAKTKAKFEVGAALTGRNGQTKQLTAGMAGKATNLIDLISQLVEIERNFEDQIGGAKEASFAKTQTLLSNIFQGFSFYTGVKEDDLITDQESVKKIIEKTTDILIGFLSAKKQLEFLKLGLQHLQLKDGLKNTLINNFYPAVRKELENKFQRINGEVLENLFQALKMSDALDRFKAICDDENSLIPQLLKDKFFEYVLNNENFPEDRFKIQEILETPDSEENKDTNAVAVKNGLELIARVSDIFKEYPLGSEKMLDTESFNYLTARCNLDIQSNFYDHDGRKRMLLAPIETIILCLSHEQQQKIIKAEYAAPEKVSLHELVDIIYPERKLIADKISGLDEKYYKDFFDALAYAGAVEEFKAVCDEKRTFVPDFLKEKFYKFYKENYDSGLTIIPVNKLIERDDTDPLETGGPGDGHGNMQFHAFQNRLQILVRDFLLEDKILDLKEEHITIFADKKAKIDNLLSERNRAEEEASEEYYIVRIRKPSADDPEKFEIEADVVVNDFYGRNTFVAKKLLELDLASPDFKYRVSELKDNDAVWTSKFGDKLRWYDKIQTIILADINTYPVELKRRISLKEENIVSKLKRTFIMHVTNSSSDLLPTTDDDTIYKVGPLAYRTTVDRSYKNLISLKEDENIRKVLKGEDRDNYNARSVFSDVINEATRGEAKYEALLDKRHAVNAARLYACALNFKKDNELVLQAAFVDVASCGFDLATLSWAFEKGAVAGFLPQDKPDSVTTKQWRAAQEAEDINSFIVALGLGQYNPDCPEELIPVGKN